MSIFHHSMTTFGYITIAIVEDIYTQNVLTVSPGMFCTTKQKNRHRSCEFSSGNNINAIISGFKKLNAKISIEWIISQCGCQQTYSLLRVRMGILIKCLMSSDVILMTIYLNEINIWYLSRKHRRMTIFREVKK